jgi:hypothetical protein
MESAQSKQDLVKLFRGNGDDLDELVKLAEQHLNTKLVDSDVANVTSAVNSADGQML